MYPWHTPLSIGFIGELPSMLLVPRFHKRRLTFYCSFTALPIIKPNMIVIRGITGGQTDKWTYKTLPLLSNSLAFIIPNKIASRLSARKPRKKDSRHYQSLRDLSKTHMTSGV